MRHAAAFRYRFFSYGLRNACRFFTAARQQRVFRGNSLPQAWES